jgi:hypothetical protein
MNVLDNYKEELLNLGDPQPTDEDTYFCKFNYNNMPFMVKTNKICGFKTVRKNNNYVNISITSTDYLLWFETFYKWCIQTFHERSEDWFEEPLTLSELEFSFINPLKSNIKDTCFDIQCVTDINRLHIVDTKDNVTSLESLNDCNIIPTFHIKGVTFNDKYFRLDIEINNILVILEDLDIDSEPVQMSQKDSNETKEIKQSNEQKEKKETKESNKDKEPKETKQSNEQKEIKEIKEKSNEYLENQSNELNELNEVSIPTNDLEEMEMDIENNSFYKIYELLDERIKNNVIQNIQKILNKKKIKLNVDIMDIFDDEEE